MVILDLFEEIEKEIRQERIEDVLAKIDSAKNEWEIQDALGVFDSVYHVGYDLDKAYNFADDYRLYVGKYKGKKGKAFKDDLKEKLQPIFDKYF